MEKAREKACNIHAERRLSKYLGALKHREITASSGCTATVWSMYHERDKARADAAETTRAH